MKGGQMHMLLAYLLGSVILILVFTLGYYFVSSLSDQEESISKLYITKNIRKDVETVSGDYGTVKRITYHVPNDIDEVCFYEKQENPAYCEGDIILGEASGKIRAFIDDDVDTNMFLFDEGLVGREEIGGFTLGCREVVCFENDGGEVVITLEGLGDEALIGK